LNGWQAVVEVKSLVVLMPLLSVAVVGSISFGLSRRLVLDVALYPFPELANRRADIAAGMAQLSGAEKHQRQCEHHDLVPDAVNAEPGALRVLL
jgi:hypothetical protein